MSRNRQCFDPLDKWHGHEDCHKCSGKDDGAPLAVVKFRAANWVPHAETQPEPVSAPGAVEGEAGTLLPLGGGGE